MKKLDDFVLDLLVRPLKQHNTTDSAVVSEQDAAANNLIDQESLSEPRFNAIFEDFDVNGQYDEKLHREWRFASPVSTRPLTTTNLCKILKSAGYASESETVELLIRFSENVNNLKKGLITANELLCYSSLITKISQCFENNSDLYRYSFPADEHEKQRLTLSSDYFVFEQLNVLLLLLGEYSVQAHGKTSKLDPERCAHQWHLCSEVLQVMLRLCERSLKGLEDKDSTSGKIRYFEAPTSISNNNATTAPSLAEDYIELRKYILYALGGVNNIEARIHLCQAAKGEALYQAVIAKDGTGATGRFVRDCHLPLLCTIWQSYQKATQCASNYSDENKLYHYVLFMGHLWHCKIQYQLAKMESESFLSALENENETADELEQSQKTLGRLLFILKPIKALETTETILSLDASLTQQYNSIVNEISNLTALVDHQVYKKRHIKEITNNTLFDLTQYALSNALELTVLASTRQRAFQSYQEKYPLLEKTLDLLQNLRATPPQQHLSAPYNNTNELAPISLSSSSYDENAIAYGRLLEREAWLRSLIVRYQGGKTQLKLGFSYHDQFTQELEKVTETIQEHRSKLIVQQEK